MAITNGTYLTNLVNPQVLADMVQEKLIPKIILAPLARVDMTLQGIPGNTITLPTYEYIGDAADVGEGEAIPISALSATTKQVTVKKAGKGVKITDEAVLSGYGDPMGESASQLATSIASKIEIDLLAALDGNTVNVYTTTTTKLTADDIADALVKFGEEIDGDKVLLVDAVGYGELRKSNNWIPNTEIGADMIVRGIVGMVHGCQVKVSNRIKGTYHIVKPGALAIYMKRDIMIESDRDIEYKYTAITADKHYTAYLYDESKAIKIVKKTA